MFGHVPNLKQAAHEEKTTNGERLAYYGQLCESLPRDLTSLSPLIIGFMFTAIWQASENCLLMMGNQYIQTSVKTEGNFATATKFIASKDPNNALVIKKPKKELTRESQKKWMKELSAWNTVYPRELSHLLFMDSSQKKLLMIMPMKGNMSFNMAVKNASSLEIELRLFLAAELNLKFLHTRNIVHGDIHSGNMRVDFKKEKNNRLFFIDFGESQQIDCKDESIGFNYDVACLCKTFLLASPRLNQTNSHLINILDGMANNDDLIYPLDIIIAATKYELAKVSTDKKEINELLNDILKTKDLPKFSKTLHNSAMSLYHEMQQMLDEKKSKMTYSQ